MSDLRELGERFFLILVAGIFCFENHKKPSDGSKEVSMAEIEKLRVKCLSCGVNLDVVKILNTHVYVR
jgi:hypothetical protein